MSGDALRPELAAALAEVARDVTRSLDEFLPLPEGPEARLVEAMRYACLEGGKRMRPFLVIQGAALFNVAHDSALRVAAAAEMAHCYSLIHDDLPAMDDDDLRRGRPTVHKQFDEATAILAGDALQTRAFKILAHGHTHGDPQVRADLVYALADAIGASGMAGGQAIDLFSERASLDIGQITRLQRMKTGALIAFACAAGAILGKAPASAHLALRSYAHDLGLAFQIADDLLDAEGTTEETGKRTGKDAVRGKATFVAVLGPERARAHALLLADQAGRHLDLFGEKAEFLREIARWAAIRRA